MALTQDQIDCLDSVQGMINAVPDYEFPSPDDILFEIYESQDTPKEKCEQFWIWLRQHIQ